MSQNKEKEDCIDDNYVSSSEDEFVFGMYDDERLKETSVNVNFADNSDSGNSSDSEIISPRKRRVPHILDSDSDEEECGNTDEDEEWKKVTETDENPRRIEFSIFPKVTGPQVPHNIKEPIQFFKLLVTDEVIDNIMKETNDYAKTKIEGRPLSTGSI